MQAARDLERRVGELERKLRRTHSGAALVGLSAVMLALSGGAIEDPIQKELRAHRLVIVDDQGVPCVFIGQDAPETKRRALAAGISIFDKHGNERGGFSTFDDGSVVLAMDAPKGVGDPMPDRLGLTVGPLGQAEVMLIDNKTRGVVKLRSEGDGKGGLQLFRWDMNDKKIHMKTLTFDDEEKHSFDMGG